MNSATIGSVRYKFSTLPSTNRFAQLLLSKTRPRAGTVITAAYQAAGEGQFGRSWYGSKGSNLFLSLILFPKIPPSSQFILSAYAAMSSRDAISQLTGLSGISIKWPNDLYINEKKVGGVLIQNTIIAGAVAKTVIGIGINVNEAEFPADLPNPTSMKVETGVSYKIDTVADTFVAVLDDWHEKVRRMNLDQVRAAYEASMYCLGEKATFAFPDSGKTTEASILGVDDAGRILLEMEGVTKRFALSQIRQKVI